MGPGHVLCALPCRRPDAYQPELLGRVLTVERRITRAGGNTFSIKNSTGVVVSSFEGERG